MTRSRARSGGVGVVVVVVVVVAVVVVAVVAAAVAVVVVVSPPKIVAMGGVTFIATHFRGRSPPILSGCRGLKK